MTNATKHPDAAYTFTYDFGGELAGATLNDILDVTVTPGGLTKGSSTIRDDGRAILVFWEGGTVGTDYVTTAKGLASDGSRLVVVGVISVRAPVADASAAGRWQQSDLDKVRSAISSGLRSVTFADGRRTEYQSLDHLIAAEKVISAELKMAAQAISGVVRRRLPYYRSGL